MLDITFHRDETRWPDYGLSNKSQGPRPTRCDINQRSIPVFNQSDALIGICNLAEGDIVKRVESEQDNNEVIVPTLVGLAEMETSSLRYRKV